MNSLNTLRQLCANYHRSSTAIHSAISNLSHTPIRAVAGNASSIGSSSTRSHRSLGTNRTVGANHDIHRSNHKSYASLHVHSQSHSVVRTIVTITKTSSSNPNDGNNTNEQLPPPSNMTSSPNTSQSPILTNTSTNTTTNSPNQDITITPACIKRIQHLAKIKNIPPSSLYLRIYVDAGGCSGFQYQFEILTHSAEPLDPIQDVQFFVDNDDDDNDDDNDDKDDNGQKTSVVLDQDSLEMMKGSTIDYVSEMIRSGFKIVDNPLSESACGCGSSFAIKNFEANR